MTEMNLTYEKKSYDGTLSVTAEEVERLVLEAKRGESLVYESEMGKILLSDGVLTVSGFEKIPALFVVNEADYYGRMIQNYRSDEAKPLKALVKEVVISDGTAQIVESFIGFSNLKRASVPDSVFRIDNAFAHCPLLEPYKLPLSLRIMRGSIFGKFPLEVTLPSGVSEIGRGSFPPAYVESYPFANSPIRSITLSDSLTEISANSFRYCKSLKRIVIPEGVERIAESAFAHCSKLCEVYLPRSLKEIDAYAFSHCDSLERVEINSDCYVDNMAFYGSPYDAVMQKKRLVAAEPLEYTEEMGEILEYEMIRAALDGIGLESQLDSFRLVSTTSNSVSSYGESNGESLSDRGGPLSDGSVEKLILRDGVIVGGVVDSCNLIVGKEVCTYSASEDDGVGVRERQDYALIVFLKRIKTKK